MIVNAESALIQPLDRDYNKKGRPRKVHLEVKNDGISHALRAGGQTLVLEKLDTSSFDGGYVENNQD